MTHPYEGLTQRQELSHLELRWLTNGTVLQFSTIHSLYIRAVCLEVAQGRIARDDMSAFDSFPQDGQCYHSYLLLYSM